MFFFLLHKSPPDSLRDPADDSGQAHDEIVKRQNREIEKETRILFNFTVPTRQTVQQPVQQTVFTSLFTSSTLSAYCDLPLSVDN